eukprot:COSAG01_NODE_6190_length_3803_cov_3.030238_4_plen_163_part_00
MSTPLALAGLLRPRRLNSPPFLPHRTLPSASVRSRRRCSALYCAYACTASADSAFLSVDGSDAHSRRPEGGSSAGCRHNGDFLSSRGGCQSRWHALVSCVHGDSTAGRLDSPPGAETCARPTPRARSSCSESQVWPLNSASEIECVGKSQSVQSSDHHNRHN